MFHPRMCAEFQINDTRLKPGRRVVAWLEKEAKQLVWAGFAREEKLGFWKKVKGGKLVDVPAHRFAERSEKTGQLVWDDVPPGQVIRGLMDPNEGKVPLLKIVTRASTPEELARFEHPRMPLIEAPIWSDEAILPDPEPLPTRPVPPQTDFLPGF